jgi:prevent-host-death family protein
MMVVRIFLVKRHRMTNSISVAEAKSRFSDLVDRASFGRERFLIERSGNPVAAIVCAEDLARLEEAPRPAGRGLLAAVGALADVEALDAIMAEISRQRRGAVDREITLE